MEPVRTKQSVVLLMVFALVVGITLGCTPQQNEKPSTPKKTDPPSPSIEDKAEKTAGKLSGKSPERSLAHNQKVVKEPLHQTDGVKQTPAVAENSEFGLLKKTSLLTLNSAQLEIATTDDSRDDSSSNTSATVTSADATTPELPDDDFPRDETRTETAKRLGPPLVKHPNKLKRLDKVDSIWLDKPGGRLIMVGEVCQREAPLEMFVCLWHTKEHEAVLTTRVSAKVAHAGLLALGAKVGNPVQFMPKYIPAAGTAIDIDVIWKDKTGKIQKKRAQQWIRNLLTKKPMEREWVFAGSGFWTDERTGKKHYQAESGDFICVSNFSTAMLDLPVKSTQQNEGLMFGAFTKHIPPLGTPVTIVLKPRLDKDKKTKGKPPELKQ